MFALKTPDVANNSMKKILLIEDDRMVSNLIKSFLEKSNFTVEQVFSGDLARMAIIEHQPDLVLLDIGLPDVDGLNVCHELREVYDEPIIVLTARQTDEDQINAFKYGADDFISKPVSPRVLKVRIEAMLRRMPTNKDRHNAVFKIGNIVLYPQAHKCEVDGNSVQLSTFEFQLLILLSQNVGQVLTRNAIYRALLNREYNKAERTVDVRISKLREKLANAGKSSINIETVWGEGYILSETAA